MSKGSEAIKCPSWRKQGDPDTDLSQCDADLLMTALRGLPLVLSDIARSEQIEYPETAKDIEYVSCKLERLVSELHRRLVSSEKLTITPAQKSNHSGVSDATRPKDKRRKRMPDGTLEFTN